jgi:hypothetical protein
VSLSSRRPTIAQDFWAFHTKHPIVYSTLVEMTREWRRVRGPGKVSIAMFWQSMRHQWGLHGLPDPDEEFKLNNNYTSHYARLIMLSEPDLDAAYETRLLRSD